MGQHCRGDRDTLDGVRSVYCVAGGYWSTTLVGIEVDFGFHPDFFPDHHPDADHHIDGKISTLAVNAIVEAPLRSATALSRSTPTKSKSRAADQDCPLTAALT